MVGRTRSYHSKGQIANKFHSSKYIRWKHSRLPSNLMQFWVSRMIFKYHKSLMETLMIVSRLAIGLNQLPPLASII